MISFLRILKKHAFTLSLVASVALSLVFPGFFTSWGDFKLTKTISPLIMVIMFGMGTTLSAADFLRIAKMPLPIAVGVGLQFLVMPFTGYTIAKVLHLDPQMAVGMVLVGSVAGGTASNVIAFIAKANVALSVTMTCVSTFISPFATPLLVKFYAGSVVEIDALAMSLEIVKVTIVPIIVGQIVHKLFEKPYEKHRASIDRALAFVSMAGICIILAVIMGPAHEKAMEAGLLILGAAAVHNSVGLLSGYWATRMLMKLLPGRICEADCRTIAIEVGMQNGGMATQLAARFFSPTAALVPNIFGIWMDVSGSAIANFWGRRSEGKPAVCGSRRK